MFFIVVIFMHLKIKALVSTNTNNQHWGIVTLLYLKHSGIGSHHLIKTVEE